MIRPSLMTTEIESKSYNIELRSYRLKSYPIETRNTNGTTIQTNWVKKIDLLPFKSTSLITRSVNMNSKSYPINTN